MTGSLAALQDWSGIWRFAWSHTKQGVEAPGSMAIRFFDLHSDPVQRASEYATLALFLRGDMAPLPPGTESAEIFREEELRDPAHGASQFGSPSRDVSPWEHRVGTRLAHEEVVLSRPAPARPVPAQARPVAGSFRVVTERTCGGFAESGALDCGALRFEICAPALQSAGIPAAVWATSLDGAPLAASSRILVCHVTDAANTDAVFDGPEARSWQEQGTTPALVRRGRADIELALHPCTGTNSSLVTRHSSLRGGDNVAATVFRLSPTGTRLAEVPSSVDSATGYLSFTADTGYDSTSATFFYEIIRE